MPCVQLTPCASDPTTQFPHPPGCGSRGRATCVESLRPPWSSSASADLGRGDDHSPGGFSECSESLALCVSSAEVTVRAEPGRLLPSEPCPRGLLLSWGWGAS